MLPLGIFSSRQFTAINLITFIVYGAMGAVFFLLVLSLQVVAGFSPLQAGISLLPSTAAMLLLSSRAGALAQRFGPRWLMTGGLLVAAAGLALLTRIGPQTSYVADVLPAVLLFGLGLSMTVAPLTATVLASADERHAGVASGVNNATARAAGLLAVAGLPAAVGLSGAALHSPAGAEPRVPRGHAHLLRADGAGRGGIGAAGQQRRAPAAPRGGAAGAGMPDQLRGRRPGSRWSRGRACAPRQRGLPLSC